MAIAVLTWKLHNFGTALQAYALVNYISKKNDLNGGCKLLNYSLPRKEHIVRVRKFTVKEMLGKLNNRLCISFKNKKNKGMRIAFGDEIRIQEERFKDFYEKIPHDNHRVSKDESDYFNNLYSMIIVGSDQVWNPKYFCNTYFLDFVDDRKKYSYAASLGVNNLTSEEACFIKQQLEGHFQKVSVREKSGQKLLEKLLPNQEIVSVLDPTLLYTGEQWTQMLQLETNVGKEYILVYTLSDNTWYKDAIRRIKREVEIDKVVYITPSDNLYFYQKSSNICADAGPVEFLNLVKNASFVITDSFHGVCFSLNFEKQFVCLERFKSNSSYHENVRITDLLSEIGLRDCYVSKIDRQLLKINYKEVRLCINDLRRKSEMYLSNMISSNKGN